MVHLPALVRDDQVVALVEDVVEDVEVGDEDGVHAAQGLEDPHVVLPRLGLDVHALRGEVPAGRVHPLPGRRDDRVDRWLGEPVDRQSGMQRPQFAGDGEVAAGVPEPDG